jgi:hypothetical protein
MTETEFLDLAMRYQDGGLTPEEVAAFEAAMRDVASNRRLFAETQLRSMALHDRFRQEAFQADLSSSREAERKRASWLSRPFAAMAAGLAIGLFSASILWAIASPKVTAERIFALQDGSFEENQVLRGFPRLPGIWSGDEAEIVEGGLHGHRRLRFVSPGSDAADPSGRAISCDVFQLVDLRPLQAGLDSDSEALLELRAEFVDGRAPGAKPSVTFITQLFLFSGEPQDVHAKWPSNLHESIASASALVTTLGSGGMGRLGLARVLLPQEADFAVIQIAARPNLRPAELEALFVDDVRLTLRTQPSLPVRVAEK